VTDEVSDVPRGFEEAISHRPSGLNQFSRPPTPAAGRMTRSMRVFSTDLHSVGIAAMRVKRDAIPGLFAPVWFTPTSTGTFEVVQSDEEFNEYLASQAAALP
jgi:hypothetical protein